MKIKDNYILTALGDDYVAVPMQENSTHLQHIVRLNGTGAVIWKGLEEGLDLDQIALRITEEYEVDLEKAKEATELIINKLSAAGILEV